MINSSQNDYILVLDTLTARPPMSHSRAGQEKLAKSCTQPTKDVDNRGKARVNAASTSLEAFANVSTDTDRKIGKKTEKSGHYFALIEFYGFESRAMIGPPRSRDQKVQKNYDLCRTLWHSKS